MPKSSKSRAISLRLLSKLWAEYAEFRKPQIAPSTHKRDYQKITRRLEKIQNEAPYLETAIEIRDWLLKHYSADTSRRTLQQFNACGRWAMESDLLTKNPFEGVQRHIRPKRQSEKAWAAFTIQERDRIIQEFDVSQPFYAPWVKFLFWTACRPEEAAALRWEHIANDCSEILIIEALPVDMPEAQSTKNYQSTRFPCNARLQHLLRSLRPDPLDRNQYLFIGREGKRFNYQNFQTRQWRPLVKALVESGHIAFYLSQYHCRHTWITEALNHLSIQDVSYLARVSPHVLYKHYAGRSRRILIPEF
jgi:integrase